MGSVRFVQKLLGACCACHSKYEELEEDEFVVLSMAANIVDNWYS